MKTFSAKSSFSLLILVVNVVLLFVASMLYGRYTAVYQERLREENLGNIANLNQSAASNATALIESWEIELDDLMRYANRHPMTQDEMLAMLEDLNSNDKRQFELIGSDYTGFLARRDETGSFIPLTYRNSSSYADLRTIFDHMSGAADGAVRATPEFTDSFTALKYFALCAPVPILTADGVAENQTLMLASRAGDVLDAFNNKSGFDGMSTVLVDARGIYIVSNVDFKSDNFYQYLYVYNDLSLDQREAVRVEMEANESGELYYCNSYGQDCVYRYSRMPDNGWYCITCVPLASFRVPVFNINYAIYAVMCLIAMLGLDLFWMRTMNRRLRQSMLREKEASDAKTDFLSRMSHDIRTPLNGIIGLTALAQDEPNPPRTAEYLDSIRVSGDFLLGLVNDILDMSRVESGKMELNPEPYSFTEFSMYIHAVFEPLCAEKGLDFRMTYPEGAPAVMVDRLRLNQIFFNLLSNAVKYTPTGGLVEFFWTMDKLSQDRIALDFTVRDNGVGMSDAFQKRMFESFSQEHASAASTGAGLGLAIVRSLVELMGGRIAVSSKLGQGTSFFVHLELEMHPEHKEKLRHADLHVLKNKRVLLCEDNQVNALIVRRLLDKWGVTLEVAENGRIGLDMFASSAPGYYHAILMDIRMPEMNGLDATRAIRALERPDAAAVPIIAMTANAYDTDVTNCLEAGMNAHMSKPVQPARLCELLAQYVEQ